MNLTPPDLPQTHPITPLLPWQVELFAALKEGEEGTAEGLILEHAFELGHPFTAQDESGQSFLMAALIGECSLEMQTDLVEKGVPVDHARFDGATALSRAAEHGMAESVSFLLSQYANPNPPSVAQMMTLTPLQRAAGNSHPFCVSMLLDAGAGLCEDEDHSMTALECSVNDAFNSLQILDDELMEDQAQTGRLLLDAGADAKRVNPDMLQQLPTTHPLRQAIEAALLADDLQNALRTGAAVHKPRL